MTDQTLEAWRIDNRINLRLIERIGGTGMRCTLSQRGGRNVAGLGPDRAPLHHVRRLRRQGAEDCYHLFSAA